MLLSLLLACGAPDDSDKGVDTSTTNGTQTTDTSETADTATTPACATVNPGEDWAWHGECPGMTTPVVIAVDGCTLSLDYDAVGGMTMGMPYSATLVGQDVTFGDDNSVTGCVGVVETADKITGSCADGCTFRLNR